MINSIIINRSHQAVPSNCETLPSELIDNLDNLEKPFETCSKIVQHIISKGFDTVYLHLLPTNFQAQLIADLRATTMTRTVFFATVDEDHKHSGWIETTL